MPKTPTRPFRINLELWRRFGEATGDRSQTLREFIEWFVGDRPEPPRRAQ